MEYSYLGQNAFDANCGLPGMENPLTSCGVPCTYGDTNPFGQMAAQGYRYNGVRTFPPNPISSASCSMVPRPRDHAQPPVFPTGKYNLILQFILQCYCSGEIRFGRRKLFYVGLTLLVAST